MERYALLPVLSQSYLATAAKNNVAEQMFSTKEITEQPRKITMQILLHLSTVLAWSPALALYSR